MYDFNKIKLVIWDLDETFWTGVLSESDVSVPEDNVQLVKRLNDIGVINSICSKNNFAPVQKKLEEIGIWDQFVFASINWEPKGGRIKQLISDMQLRAENVLFIDDNTSNLEEARFFSPEIMTILPDEIPNLLCDALSSEKEDKEHKRLHQYRILEKKHSQRGNSASNEAFLYSSGIKLTWGNDCKDNIDRIHDLVWRSNQLNFTKLRSTRQELMDLLSQDSYDCGYVSVSDNFGDYGIVGFYALKDNKLLHFCFSCRTLGMGIEQYVYGKLGRPELEIIGEVVGDLDNQEIPKWINNKSDTQENTALEAKDALAHSVLIKGPCDLFQIIPYIAQKDLIDTEFTYVNENGVTIESTGHTTHIVESLRLTQTQKARLLEEVAFADAGIYSDNLYKGGYKVVVISILADANLGVYQRKGTGERIAFLEGFHPITDQANWENYINGEYNCASFRFTRDNLEQFADKYEFIGINSPEQIAENLRFIRENLPSDCTLAVMLGGELKYEKNTFPAYEKRHIVHKEINSAIRAIAEEIDIRLIDVNKYLVDQSSFYDHFNHYIKPVYYQLASDILAIINEQTEAVIKEASKLRMVQVRLKEMIAPMYYKLKKIKQIFKW